MSWEFGMLPEGVEPVGLVAPRFGCEIRNVFHCCGIVQDTGNSYASKI